jgi:hypothetical protein
MTEDVNEKLGQFLIVGQNWEKKPTNIQGVFLLKLPTSKQSSPSIDIEINPKNATTGSARKKRGIIIRSGPRSNPWNFRIPTSLWKLVPEHGKAAL